MILCHNLPVQSTATLKHFVHTIFFLPLFYLLLADAFDTQQNVLNSINCIYHIFLQDKMPSDSKKREQARKKEAQKKKGSKITTVTSKDTNGTANGVELTEEGNLVFFFCHTTQKIVTNFR